MQHTPPIHLTAITGGIGSGKSVVARILRTIGYPVYDCDLRARAIMDADPDIHRALAHRISPTVITPQGTIDRPALSAIVFAHPDKLATLNTIVHGAVRDDLTRWLHTLTTTAPSHPQPHLNPTSPLPATAPRAFVETAIPYESGLHTMVHDIWQVTAPDHIRIQRVILRSGLTPDQIRARIRAQRATPIPTHTPPIHTITNDGLTPILPTIHHLLTLNPQ